MEERRATPRHRTLFGGKIVFNSGRSAIDCRIRNLSDQGCGLDVQTPLGIPDQFYLIVGDHDDELRACQAMWRSADRIGVSFLRESSGDDAGDLEGSSDQGQVQPEVLAFRAALDQVQFGVILLDHELRAQFINRTFRTMFRLPDAKADSKPPFVALMYHGRDTRAYKVAVGDLDRYVAERVALVKAGDTRSIDIRLSDGEVLRFQCAPLPGGGRMLSYTYVTDIVNHSDELGVLHAALDRVQEGIILLDPDLNMRFMNRWVRQLWKVSDEQVVGRPNIADLIGTAVTTGAYAVAPDKLADFIAGRIAQIRSGDPTPKDIKAGDGRIIRARCDRLPSGGRMLTYSDVTDLVRNAEKMEALATVDSNTGLCNRRHFLSMAEQEWSRFQRYHRPLSMLVVDVDHFKSVNDRFGHDTGDAALKAVANALQVDRRGTDIVGRLGGDEFVLLLPETDAEKAATVADRVCAAVRDETMRAGDRAFSVSVSIGVATATLGMSSVTTLMKAADEALYEAKSRGRNRLAVARRETAVTKMAAE